MTKKPTTEDRRLMAEMLRDKDGFEHRPGNEPARVRAELAAERKKRKKRGKR